MAKFLFQQGLQNFSPSGFLRLLIIMIDFIDLSGMRSRSQERIPGKAGLNSVRMDPWFRVLFPNWFRSLSPNLTHLQNAPKLLNI